MKLVADGIQKMLVNVKLRIVLTFCLQSKILKTDTKL
jgi:hypothetical protein